MRPRPRPRAASAATSPAALRRPPARPGVAKIRHTPSGLFPGSTTSRVLRSTSPSVGTVLLAGLENHKQISGPAHNPEARARAQRRKSLPSENPRESNVDRSSFRGIQRSVSRTVRDLVTPDVKLHAPPADAADAKGTHAQGVGSQ